VQEWIAVAGAKTAYIERGSPWENGIPIAAIIAFLIVAIFESTAGNIKFEVATVKFEGAAGPIIMWVFCFMSTTISIKLLW
jgi:hypothetical protein